jgi:hypothetical protein
MGNRRQSGAEYWAGKVREIGGMLGVTYDECGSGAQMAEKTIDAVSCLINERDRIKAKYDRAVPGRKIPQCCNPDCENSATWEVKKVIYDSGARRKKAVVCEDHIPFGVRLAIGDEVAVVQLTPVEVD